MVLPTQPVLASYKYPRQQLRLYASIPVNCWPVYFSEETEICVHAGVQLAYAAIGEKPIPPYFCGYTAIDLELH